MKAAMYTQAQATVAPHASQRSNSNLYEQRNPHHRAAERRFASLGLKYELRAMEEFRNGD